LDVSPVSEPRFLLSLALLSFPAQGDDDNDELVWIDPNSGTTFLVDKRTGHSHPHIPLSLESGEESAQVISSARRTIAFAQPGDWVGEPPQWILDALEVGTIRADIGLKLMSAK
jgi:hypothetical protein